MSAKEQEESKLFVEKLKNEDEEVAKAREKAEIEQARALSDLLDQREREAKQPKFDQCCTFGCILEDRHSGEGLHSVVAVWCIAFTQ